MIILNSLYQMIIGPLKLLFEAVFSVVFLMTNNAGISIIALSLVINILMLPLNNRAEKLQQEQMDIQEKLKPGVDAIKKAFKGDEQYLILKTYYRQNNYKTLDILKSSLSLLLEIPFFIAAYDFLSNLTVLEASGFGPIKNLGEPDLLINGINILPILMTLINIVSVIIYTKGKSFKSTFQLYLMALIFLVLLYNSPAGLVLYWTCNNLFSLFKNVIKISKKTETIFVLSLSTLSVLILGGVFVLKIQMTLIQKIVFVFALVFLNIPTILRFKKHIEIQFLAKDNKKTLFYFALAFLTVFLGLFIPSDVIKTSTTEFIDSYTLVNPIHYIFESFLLSIGTFLIWINIYYSLMKKEIKNVFEICFCFLSIMCVINYFFFGKNHGNMSNLLVFDEGLSITLKDILINSALLLILLILVFIIFIYKKNILKGILIVLLSTSIVISSTNCIKINNEAKNSIEQMSLLTENSVCLPLSKTNKNVVFIMLDAAIGYYLPYLFSEKPELQEQYKGFTYYPNTLSLGKFTFTTVTSVYGGYEYTPEEINKRNQEKDVDKHNEALKVLPVLYDKNGYDVTIIDAPYANYSELNDLSIYDEYPRIKTYHHSGFFRIEGIYSFDDLSKLERNLYCYSIMKVSPLVIQENIYNSGEYNDVDSFNSRYFLSSQETIGFSEAQGIKKKFIREYATLKNMNNFTKIGDEDKGSFVMFYNQATHEDCLLQEPEYEPEYIVNNVEYDIEHKKRKSIFGDEIELCTEYQTTHYDVNMASLMKIGDWLDYLRENGVYDNTKIVIVSDHARGVGVIDNTILEDVYGGYDITKHNPLLLVKDFNSNEFTVDDSFMTNADVPTILTSNTIENPINPFTGNKINNEKKKEKQKVLLHDQTLSNDHSKEYQFPEGIWYTVEKDVLDINNWKRLENNNKTTK